MLSAKARLIMIVTSASVFTVLIIIIIILASLLRAKGSSPVTQVGPSDTKQALAVTEPVLP